MEPQTLIETANEVVGQEDRELILSCLDGDHAAWEALITRYQRLIYSIPLRVKLSEDDSADIFQSVCLKLYEKLPTLRDHAKIGSWLITTTTRECWRVSARNSRENLPTDFDESASRWERIPADALLADEQRLLLERQQMVRTAVDALPERCRKLVKMLFYQNDELSYAEIARRMKMPVPSIGPTRARCLEKLKKMLQTII